MRNIDMLNDLRTVLIRVRDLHKPFDMNSWVDTLPTRSRDVVDWEEEIGCGTASCALGWFIREPEGKKHGFSFDLGGGTFFPSHDFWGPRYWEPFGLTGIEAEWLFFPCSYTNVDVVDGSTISAVITRVDMLIAGYEVPPNFEDTADDGGIEDEL